MARLPSHTGGRRWRAVALDNVAAGVRHAWDKGWTKGRYVGEQRGRRGTLQALHCAWQQPSCLTTSLLCLHLVVIPLAAMPHPPRNVPLQTDAFHCLRARAISPATSTPATAVHCLPPPPLPYYHCLAPKRTRSGSISPQRLFIQTRCGSHAAAPWQHDPSRRASTPPALSLTVVTRYLIRIISVDSTLPSGLANSRMGPALAWNRRRLFSYLGAVAVWLSPHSPYITFTGPALHAVALPRFTTADPAVSAARHPSPTYLHCWWHGDGRGWTGRW